jgi:hypothetical protein
LNVQKGSKTFSPEFPTPSVTLPPDPASNKRSRPDRVGFGRVKRIHPIVIDSWVKGWDVLTFDSCKVGKILALVKFAEGPAII